MTSRGVSNPLKDALLARFPHVRAAFNQNAFIESLNLPHQVLADIWLPVGFPPVSFEALNEEEEMVAQSGQFANVNVRTRNNPNNPNYSNQEYRSNNNRGRGGANTGNDGRQQLNRNSRGGYVAANSRFSDRSQSHSNHHQNNHNHYEDDKIEDPDNLWATPSADAIGSSDFGTFDANGMFRTGDTSSILDGGLEDSASSTAAFKGFMQTRPHHATPISQSVPVPPSASSVASHQVSSSPPVAIPHITPDTQWVYRDPSGQIQGPFPSHRMMEWYNGKYFPENLPLRREQDAFFEPLSTWKTKCAGQIPFGAYTKEPEKPKPAPAPLPSLAPERRSESISMSQWFSEPTAELPNPASASSASNLSAPQTRSVPLASLFGVSSSNSAQTASIEKPGSPEVLMPNVAAAGWKKLEKPSISAKFGQIQLNDSESEKHNIPVPAVTSTSTVTSAATVNTAASANHTFSVSTATKEFTEISKPSQATQETSLKSSPSSTWSSSSNSALKKISLSEIMKSSEEPNIVLETSQPAQTISSASSVGGWAKISANPVQPLSAIQAEEVSVHRQQGASANSSLASSSSASKSFADLVRSAGVITSGNIVVSPTSSDRVPLVNEPVKQREPVKPVVASKPVFAATSTAASPVTKPESTVSLSLDDWCLNSLKQSSLSKSTDPQTCTILLLDLPNPAAILNFSLETLKPLDGNFDLASFAHELSTKKFGVKATEKVQWFKLKSIPQSKKEEESFEVVKRKK